MPKCIDIFASLFSSDINLISDGHFLFVFNKFFIFDLIYIYALYKALGMLCMDGWLYILLTYAIHLYIFTIQNEANIAHTCVDLDGKSKVIYNTQYLTIYVIR